MRLIRARTETSTVLARIEGDGAVVVATESGHPGADVLREALASRIDMSQAGPLVPARKLSPLAPVAHPSKIIAAGLNYAAHAREAGQDEPAAPVTFAKLPSAIVGPGDAIELRPEAAGQLDYEAELAAVIGTRIRSASSEQALAAIFAYTAANDLSARDAQFADGQWTRGKSFDGLCPLGPALVTSEEFGDPQDARVVCRVNGEVRQDESTKQMIFGVADLVAYISRDITLEPGDVVLTGTPEGVGFSRTPPVYLRDGDVVEVEISRIGLLRNTIRARRQ